MIRRASVGAYLRAIASLALEVAERPELLADFVAVIRLAPRTILGLQAAAGRVPAPQLQRDRMRCYSAPDILQ
jgi:hypothetical protein